ncbi:MAG: hypothetical protein NXH78_06080 [Hyphomonadaceae bacterium]|nr:hypothetical protein [Hyphomonadaceae bacterium]
MLHPSTKKLIDRLAEMTELGKLDWAEGENGALVYSTEGYSVCLPDGSGEVILQSIDGKELERAAADELASTMSEAGTPYAQIVAEMGAEAARFARGTETAISSLLAGMEEPEPPAPEEVAELTDDSPEDPGDESAALETEGIANHEIKAAPVPKPEPETAPDTEAADSEPAEQTVETVSDEVVAAAPDLSEEEPVDVAAEMAAAPDISEDAAEPMADVEETVEASSDDVDTESDVTEAVARLANEVNNREDTAPVEIETVSEDDSSSPDEITPSAVGVAAAAAVGVVASAAGLDQEEADEPASGPETMEADAEPEAPIAAADMGTSSAPSYIPFGLESQDDEAATVVAETPAETVEPIETSMVEDADPVVSASVASEIVSEADDTLTEAPDAPETEVTPATDFVASTVFAATPEAASDEETEVDAESEPEPELNAEASEPAIEDAPETEAVAETASEPEVEVVAEAAPVAETVQEPEAPALAEAPSEDSADAASETEVEPVMAASEEPQTYSLSGIGAGFGLGALAAKTEASGIPGPSSLVTPEPEKIVIDATEDVLPELEGNLNVEQMEAAVSEINFGNAASNDAKAESEAADDSDGDILKPRTRFNPWD